jgi:transcriptional regulator with XRE-family HTH domain
MPGHPVDLHVGKRIRLRRSMLGMSQDSLGKEIGVTFQQIQKYERGVNRVGSSRLFDFSRILNVPVGYFFDDLEAQNSPKMGFSESNDNGLDLDPMDSKETLNLVRAYYRIVDPSVRKKVLGLIRAMGPLDK